ncbi:bifunctional 4-hydroxy-2-oxoglutarate aldolase/2-dehydro-3-deoxy-phosphogluconate aldolase [Candidatus Epulonipiscium viviparus]|uniref:bifunctional 4-hydroxy-2-oxoglutarate aldolase/2-dehydro-3-deoxy-phosphogluconate aldolase n=1 Tax=Candidatus Epulonipiscium viviparus TaxID=420336 RepID=UPI0027381006|nr:bifunctional 4-hydroxy-2-oxoglutarate aldolase/2-dehydro-3-deoxy-phosphogluconate aldolase [Candidatus Epulopiscium viviparus]
MTITEKIEKIGVVPVIKIENLDHALPLAKALLDGGIPCAEVTFRTTHAKAAIKLIKEQYPQLLVGAGTVTTTQQVDDAIEAGVEFLVSPGLNPTIVKYAQSKNMPIFAGVANASDIERAMELGLYDVKFFPAEVNGGLNAIKNLAGPYTKIRFMPTGGINEKNIGEYLKYNKIIACGGSFMVPNNLMDEGKFDEISTLCKKAIKAALGIKLRHIGVNASSCEDAAKITSLFADVFMAESKEGNSSFFVSDEVEIMKEPGRGKCGHIAIGVNDIKRARGYFELMGLKFDDSSLKEKDGKVLALYFTDEIGGFACHLVAN